jgi:hypothetical protein
MTSSCACSFSRYGCASRAARQHLRLPRAAQSDVKWQYSAAKIMPLDRTIEAEDVADKKEPVKRGGICIYCGWDGGADGLRNEHTVPYSMGGNTELLAASCADCEAITSYLDGYMANAIFFEFRSR